MELTAQKTASQLPVDRRERGVTPRVVVLCLALAVFFGYVIPVVDYKFFNTFLGATHLPPGAIAALLLLIGVVNPVLRVISRRAQLSRNEMLTVYLSCLFSCLVPGIGGNNYWVSYIIGAFYYSTRENGWFDFFKGLPPWFTPALNADGSYNRFVAEAWNNGLSDGQTIPWGAWLVPLGAWGAFFLASFGMLACLSAMLAAQWSDREALSYPLLRLPLQMTEDTSARGESVSFWKNGLMWLGFGCAAALQLLNGLNSYFPEVPSIATFIHSGPYLTEAPWNQLGYAPIFIFPIAIGIAFLLTTEVSFSFWSFYWLLKLQLVAAYLIGFTPSALPSMLSTSGPQFTGYQEVGANFMFFGLILWAARRHLAHIAARAFGRVPATSEEKHEALPYPLAFWGFWLSFGFMVAWGVAAGMSFGLSLLLWTMYLVIAVVLSRVVAEGGLLFVHHSWSPLGALAPLLGVGNGTLLSPSHGLATASFLEFATMEDYRGNLMPSFVQSFKLARDRGIAARPLLLLLLGVIGVGMLMAFSMNVRLGYENGGLSLQWWLSKGGPQELGNRTAKLLSKSQGVDPVAWVWTVVGMATIYAIIAARSRFAWFPFHPLGYLMALTIPMNFFWFSLLVGWACKTLIGKYGGPDSVRRVTPFFLGLVLGDVVMMLFWLVIDGWQGHTGHQLMPG